MEGGADQGEWVMALLRSLYAGLRLTINGVKARWPARWVANSWAAAVG